MATPLRDHILLIDGPLAGRALCLEMTLRVPIDIHAAVAPDGRVLAIEGERAPTDVPHRGVEYRYAPVMAKDGYQSRDDDGYLRFYLIREDCR